MTHFSSMSHFYTAENVRKTLIFWRFQWIKKLNIGLKWVNVWLQILITQHCWKIPVQSKPYKRREYFGYRIVKYLRNKIQCLTHVAAQTFIQFKWDLNNIFYQLCKCVGLTKEIRRWYINDYIWQVTGENRAISQNKLRKFFFASDAATRSKLRKKFGWSFWNIASKRCNTSFYQIGGVVMFLWICFMKMLYNFCVNKYFFLIWILNLIH